MKQYLVILKNKRKETKEFRVEASSSMDAMIIALKQKENEDFYIYGIKKAE
jgi:hypothetical protein